MPQPNPTTIFTLSACLLLATFILTGCIGPTETRALKEAAIRDARKEPSAVHLAYLQCYALLSSKKSRCQRSIRTGAARQKARKWEYIRPYRSEAERLGFATFLHKQDMPCVAVEDVVRFRKEDFAYLVNCTDGIQYRMRFDRENQQWGIL